MKKLLLITVTVMGLLSMTAKAQTFEFQYQGKTVDDGGMVIIPAQEDDFGFGELWCESNPSDNPGNGLMLKLLNGNTANGKATVNIISNTMNPSVIKWCMGGECTMFNNKTSITKNFAVSDGIVQTQFDAEGIQNKGYMLASLEATIGVETHKVMVQFSNGMTAATADIQATDGQIWWGYFNDVDAANIRKLGTGIKEDFEAAIHIPSNHNIAGEAKISAVRVWIGQDYVNELNSFKVWIAKSLSKNAENAVYVQEVSVNSLKAGANDIPLTTPFDVKNEAVYVGYSMGLNVMAYAWMRGGEWVENSFFIRSTTTVPEWDSSDSYGKIALQLLLDGVKIDSYSATPEDFDTSYVLTEEQVTIPVIINNTGKEPISSIAYTITSDGNTSPETTYNLNNITFNTSGTAYIKLKADKDFKKIEKILTITKVNGQPNQAKVKQAKGMLITISQKPAAVPVVEEFTGTWCGWCPFGIMGMESAKNTFGDNVVLIAAHASDIMAIEDYSPIVNRTSSFPSSFVNRSSSVYPSEWGLYQSINSALEITTVGKIQAEAMWTDNDKNDIQVNTQTEFVYQDDNADYGIAFVLIEDGLTGTGSQWAQSNYMSNEENYKSYSFWYNSPEYVSGLEYNHVAVGAWGIENGMDNSVKKAFKEGELLNYKYVADISSKKLIQDKTKLKMAVLLIDRSNGIIVNAAQTDIQEFSVNKNPYDVNKDGNVDISDIVAVINIIAGIDTRFDGNVNNDDNVDISDIVAIINYIASGKE